jgi:spermidine synthase
VSKQRAPGRKGFFGFLVITALVSGAMVMVVEVLGSKVIGPVFGVSLFVWTSLIAVTLVALAGGYALGGVLADRHPSADALYGILAAAGVLVLLVPFAKSGVLRLCQPLGLRLGALASAALLFGPPLLLLGFVSPYLVRLAARELDRIGRTVGVFYSVSTLGSFAGTVLAGFYLLAYFGVSRIFQLVGALLVALAVAYFVFFRRRAAALLLLALPLLLSHEQPLRTTTAPDGTRVVEVLSRDTYYGHLTVIDYHHGPQRYREMLLDGQVQGAVDTANGLSIFAYTYFLQLVPTGLRPGGERCLVMGLGPGVVPMWYERQGIAADVVDINRDLVEVAKSHFGFAVSGDVVVGDARRHLATSRRSYDYVIFDVFNGDTTPEHLMSIEAMRLAKARVRPGGVLAVNVMGSLRHDNFVTASVARTLEAVFESVAIFPVFPADAEEQAGSVVMVAWDGAARSFPAGRFDRAPVHPLVRQRLGRSAGWRFRFPVETRAIVLSDEYNPIGFFDLWVKERAREGILKDIYLDLLL